MSSLNGLPFALVSDSYLTQESTDSALKGCIKARLRQQQNMHKLQSFMKNRKKNICEVARLVFFSGVNSQRAVEMNAAEGTASALLTDEPAADLSDGSLCLHRQRWIRSRTTYESVHNVI